MHTSEWFVAIEEDRQAAVSSKENVTEISPLKKRYIRIIAARYLPNCLLNMESLIPGSASHDGTYR